MGSTSMFFPSWTTWLAEVVPTEHISSSDRYQTALKLEQGIDLLACAFRCRYARGVIFWFLFFLLALMQARVGSSLGYG